MYIDPNLQGTPSSLPPGVSISGELGSGVLQIQYQSLTTGNEDLAADDPSPSALFLIYESFSTNENIANPSAAFNLNIFSQKVEADNGKNRKGSNYLESILSLDYP